eukprot:g4965.t1
MGNIVSPREDCKDQLCCRGSCFLDCDKDKGKKQTEKLSLEAFKNSTRGRVRGSRGVSPRKDSLRPFPSLPSSSTADEFTGKVKHVQGSFLGKHYWNPPRDLENAVDYREGIIEFIESKGERKGRWQGKKVYTNQWARTRMKTTQISLYGEWSLVNDKDLHFEVTHLKELEDLKTSKPEHTVKDCSDFDWKPLIWVIDITKSKNDGGLGL